MSTAIQPTPHPFNPKAVDTRTRHRRNLVLRYTVAGFSLRQIHQMVNEQTAKELGEEYCVTYESIKNDRHVVLGQIKDELKENLETYRALLLERYDIVLQTLYPMVKNGHLGAIDRWLKTIAQIGDLTGANAPLKLEVENTTQLTEDERRARVMELIQLAKARALGQEPDVIEVLPEPDEHTD